MSEPGKGREESDSSDAKQTAAEAPAQPPGEISNDAPIDPRWLLRFLYNHNPFYLISAAFVLYGFQLRFGQQADGYNAWLMLGLLAGYVLLLAATAFVIVRFGKVWDDARTILLVIVLLLMWLSISFDQVVAADLSTGTWLLAIGFLFSIGVSEGLLHGLGMRLPLWFRIPYYLTLALMFSYPRLLAELLERELRTEVSWALYLFSPVAGLIALTLIPAVRRGAEYVVENGTPWKWPLYPWSLFFILAVGICGRCFWLSISFDPVKEMDLAAGYYFLVPFLFCVNVLLLEIAVVSKVRVLRDVALGWAPLALLFLSLPGKSPNTAYTAFLNLMIWKVGSPVFLYLAALAIYYAYARLRGVKEAGVGLILSLLLLVYVGPETTGVKTFNQPQSTPMLAAMLVQWAMAWKYRSSWGLFLGCVFGVVWTSMVMPAPLATYRTELAAHLIVAAALLIGAFAKDEGAEELRCLGGLGLAALFLAVLLEGSWIFSSIEPLVQASYAAASIAFCTGYWWWFRFDFFLSILRFQLAAATVCAGWTFWREPIALGAVFFVLAFLISASKGGWLKRWKAFEP